MLYCACIGDPHCRSFAHDLFDHMAAGVFEMLDSPAASLGVQTYQCPMEADFNHWGSDASSNVAVAARSGDTRFIFLGDTLQAIDSAGATVLDVVGESLEATVATLQTSAGDVGVRRERYGGRGWYRWRLEMASAFVTVTNRAALTMGG